MGEVTGVLIVATVFGTSAWVISVFVDAFRRRQQTRVAAEFQSKLLEKIDSALEFGEFLNTDGGSRFLESIKVQEPESSPHARILRALQSGIVLTLIGVSLFVLTGNRELPYDVEDGMVIFATLTTATGIGLLLATGATYAMSKRLGLLNGQRSHSKHPTDLA